MKRIVITAGFFFLLAPIAEADIVMYEFSGVGDRLYEYTYDENGVSQTSVNSSSRFGVTINKTDTFHGIFTYNTDAQVTKIVNGDTYASFDTSGSRLDINFDFGHYSTEELENKHFLIGNNITSLPLLGEPDMLKFGGNNKFSEPDQIWHSMGVSFFDRSAKVFDNYNNVPSEISLDSFSDAYVEFRIFEKSIGSTGDNYFRGNITSLEEIFSVTESKDYLTDVITLGSTFSFDYLWEMGTEPTEWNFDFLVFNGTEWETLGWNLNFEGSSEGWQSASFYVPTWARGENAQIKFQVFDWGQNTDPTVYLKNIESIPTPEPTTMLLFGIGIASLAAVGRKRK